MRLVQISIHVERFGNTVPKDWPAKDKRQRIHVYADGNNFSEVLMGAVAKVYETVSDSEGAYPGVVRLDEVDNGSGNEDDVHIVAACEPRRPIDLQDVLYLVRRHNAEVAEAEAAESNAEEKVDGEHQE